MTTRSTATNGSTLSGRYVHAVTRRLPKDQRDDVAQELHASITDRVEILLEAHPDYSSFEAEHAALVELGDPARLSAEYAERQLQLIGPELYPSYARVMRSLLYTAVPAVTVVVAAIDIAASASLGEVIGGAVWAAFSATVQVAFWTTLTFALVERAEDREGLRSSLTLEWTPDDLMEVGRDTRGSISDFVANFVWLGLIGGLIIWQQVASPLSNDDGQRLPLLDPDLWSFWLPMILVLLLLKMTLELTKYRLGAWSPTLFVANVLAGLAFAASLLYLCLDDHLFNQAAVAEIQKSWSDYGDYVANAIVFGIALSGLGWESFREWRKTWA